MAGALQHLASGNPKKMECLAYRKGLNAPDYFRKGLIKSEADFEEYIRGCKREEMLSYEDFKKVCKSTHFMDNPRHSSRPVLIRLFNAEYIDLSKPFWDAYATHIIGDKLYYLTDEYVDMTRFRKDKKLDEKRTVEALHNDYSYINFIVEDTFHVYSELTTEIKKLNLIRFVEGTPTYQNPNSIIKWVHLVRELTKEMDTGKISEYFYRRSVEEQITL